MSTTALQTKLDEIYSTLAENEFNSEDIGVLSGSAGLALFYFYYARFKNDEGGIALGSREITTIVQKINKGYNFHTYCGGIAGAAWTIELLNELEFIDVDSDALLQGLDSFLSRIFHIDTKENFYDFLHGILGTGHYFLKRYKNTSSEKFKERYRTYIQTILGLLDRTAIWEKEGCHWEANLIREEGLRGSNLGLAHGISSIVNFLSRLLYDATFKDLAKKLLNGAVHYVLGLRNPNSKGISAFPDWVTNAGEENRSNRLAWCYGDLGTGLSLWRAGRALQQQEITSVAIEVLRTAAILRNPEETRICDGGLCHGAFGVMHIFDFLFKETKEEVFKIAADYWGEYGLSLEIANLGFMKWKGGDDSGWEPEDNLLEGNAGIGLAIIAHLDPKLMDWDQCLLIG